MLQKEFGAYVKSSIRTGTLSSPKENISALKVRTFSCIRNLCQQKDGAGVFEDRMEGVLLLDEDLRVIDANQYLARLLTLDHNEIIGKDCHTVFLNHQAICPHCLLAKENVHQRNADSIFRGNLRSPDGKDSQFVVSLIHLEGNRYGPLLLLIFRNITSSALDNEQALEEKSMLKAQLQHAKRIENMGEIVSEISHDFRNILAGIMTSCQLIQLKHRENDEILGATEGIINLVRTGSDLIDNLMQFSRTKATE